MPEIRFTTDQIHEPADRTSCETILHSVTGYRQVRSLGRMSQAFKSPQPGQAAAAPMSRASLVRFQKLQQFRIEFVRRLEKRHMPHIGNQNQARVWDCLGQMLQLLGIIRAVQIAA